MEDNASGASSVGAGSHPDGAEGLISLDSLPDDALLLVLGFLDTPSLLQSRGVCRRLRDAALHPHLWRKRRVDVVWDRDRWVAAATLRLAPCLGSLSLKLHGQLLETLLASTNCAISALDVQEALFSAVPVAKALARQAVLGRVKTVSLKSWNLRGSDTEIRMLLDQLLHIQGLTSIILELFSCHDSPDFESPAADRAVAASLRLLEYSWKKGPPSLPGTLLQWHAATLEVVHFPRFEPLAVTAALLAALPRLRELQCPILEDMPALLRCPALKSLYLRCVDKVGEEDNFPTGPLLRGVQQFLRQATERLETLTFGFEQVKGNTWYPASQNLTNLVLCLAGSSAPSALRSLRLTYNFLSGVPQPQLVPLASVLHRLENLVSLDLGGPHTEEFFAAMDGRVLPRLERLCIFLVDNEYSDSWGGGCPHEWAHGEEPCTLLRRYPRLHVELGSLHDWDSQCCVYDVCHTFFTNSGGSVCTLFSHPEDEPCGQEHAENELQIDFDW